MRGLYFLTRLLDSPESRGKFGEMIVSSIFDNRYFGDEEHYIINNLIIEYNGTTHQLDHVVIYKTGIFCIETKNLSGIVLGDVEHPIWTQIVNRRRYLFESPVLQNEGHIKALKYFLGIEEDIHSIVVFIKGNKPKGTGFPIVNLTELREAVKEFNSGNELTSDLMKYYYKILKDYKEEGIITLQKHIENISKK